MNTSNNPLEFLQAVLESFVDGILVLTEEKEQKYANHMAVEICQQLTGKSCTIPKEVWQVCEALIGSRKLYSEHPTVVESEVECETTKLRIRAQWLSFEAFQHPCLLVRLQNQHQAAQGLAIAEAQVWGLTERETQVWIRRRADCSRKQIATELYIAVDTVKKHLKNIQAKRQNYLDQNTWHSNSRQRQPPAFYSAALCH